VLNRLAALRMAAKRVACLIEFRGAVGDDAKGFQSYARLAG